jgi:uncharacterized membrane protein
MTEEDQREPWPYQIMTGIYGGILMMLYALVVAVVVTGATTYLALVYWAMNGRWPG